MDLKTLEEENDFILMRCEVMLVVVSNMILCILTINVCRMIFSYQRFESQNACSLFNKSMVLILQSSVVDSLLIN